ncbi:MAG TPA: hypothetical protein VMZ04_05350, partial [Anaerolineae bacterium]|nr:hypothetical protein [Anaerolineae bacterium]
MDKYIFFTIICLISALFIASYALADYFDSTLLLQNSKHIIFNNIYDIPTVADSLNLPDKTSSGYFSNSIPPRKDISKPDVTFTDSIKIEQNYVKRMREVKGLKTDVFSLVSLNTYLEKNLKKSFNAQWQNNSNRIGKWTGTKKGSISDLDLVLPSQALARFLGGQTRLNIDGSQKITFSGRSEWTEGQIETSISKNSSFPSLTMKQEPQFRIQGIIADRITVDIKQDPQTGPFSNLEENISIKYQGEDQDIIKNIEAGNTSLRLEGATFAGYRADHKGLFGIRSEGQIGPLKFTTIASQEKSEANMKSFRGSAEETSTQIRDYDYKANTYFFIDKKYRYRFEVARDSFDRILYIPSDSLAVIEVYADDGIINNNIQEGTFALRGIALPIDMEGNIENPDAAIEGYFHRLDPVDSQQGYYVDRSLGFIQFNRRIPDEWTIGVYLKTRSGEVFGSLNYDPNDESSKIKLKLIKPKKQRPTDVDTWNLEWKNVYDLGQRNIEPQGLEIRIYRQATDGVSRDTQDGIPYIQILGLDKSDEMGNPKPDNKIDLNRAFINFSRGELIFPLLEPFNSDVPPGNQPPGFETPLIKKEDRVPEIYNTQNMQEKMETTKFYIDVKTATRQATIQIGGGFAGIMEGTEQVLLNGKPLTRGTDYRIDYFSGRVTLLNEEAMSPTADIVIRFEEPGVMQQMQKTLLGIRGEYDLFS